MSSRKETSVLNYLDFVADSAGMDEETRKAAESMLREHGRVRVTIRPFREKRSIEQNKLFSLFCRRIAKQTGMRFDDVKEIIKSYAVDIGYPVARNADGDLLTDERGELVPLPSHLADTAEFSILLDACHQIAYEYNLTISSESP